MRTTSLAGTRSARFLPRLAEQSAEWQHVQAELQEGRRLVRVFYGLTTWSPLGLATATSARSSRSTRPQAGILIDERYLQIQGLLAAMPLTLADGLAADMVRLKRFKTLLSTTAANIAPMQGEYLGGNVPHLLFVGRRGQPFFWSPFENEAGNHNVAICGKSGSGKSVLLQEMCAALRGAGAKVVVIDDGRSFEHSVKLQGGRFVEFTLKAGFCLNPFSMIDAARAAKKTRITGSTALAWSKRLLGRWRGIQRGFPIPSAVSSTARSTRSGKPASRSASVTQGRRSARRNGERDRR
jgi:conjugal transfer ATP-binding protein TraC